MFFRDKSCSLSVSFKTQYFASWRWMTMFCSLDGQDENNIKMKWFSLDLGAQVPNHYFIKRIAYFSSRFKISENHALRNDVFCCLPFYFQPIFRVGHVLTPKCVTLQFWVNIHQIFLRKKYPCGHRGYVLMS